MLRRLNDFISTYVLFCDNVDSMLTRVTIQGSLNEYATRQLVRHQKKKCFLSRFNSYTSNFCSYTLPKTALIDKYHNIVS